jgi:hypothetical protein
MEFGLSSMGAQYSIARGSTAARAALLQHSRCVTNELLQQLGGL